MVFDSLLQENTHIGSDNYPIVECEDSVAVIAYMIESAQESQSIFESLVNLDFAEIAMSKNVAGITESTVTSILEGSEGVKGVLEKIKDAIMKLWGSFMDFVDKMINTIRTYLTRDTAKLVSKSTLKSTEELEKIVLPVYKKYDFFKFNTYTSIEVPKISEPTSEDLDEMEKMAKDHKAFMKHATKELFGKSFDNNKDFCEFIKESTVTELKEVKVSDIIDEIKTILSAGNKALEAIKNTRKASNNEYSDTVKCVNQYIKSIKKSGSYTTSDEEGTNTKIDVERENKDNMIKYLSYTLGKLKNAHNLDVAKLKTVQSLAREEISQAKAIFIKAMAGRKKGDAAEDKETEIKEFAALVETCEFETEMDMEAILVSEDFV